MAAISRGLAGEELTEMGELAAAGAVAFTDDGKPVRSAALMRRALQYAGSTGRRLALHCEEPTLSHHGQMHEGVVSAELGLGGYPSVAESVVVGARPGAGRLRERSRYTSCISPRASRSSCCGARSPTACGRAPR